MKQLFSTKALLLVGTLLLMAACTAVLQRGHSDKRQTKSVSMPLDSLILKKEDNGYGYTTIYFDTTKLKYFPDLDPISLVTLPKYKALFGLTDDYSLVKDSVEQIGRKRIAYKNIPYRGSSYSYDAIDNKLIRAKVCKFTPKYEPTDIKISMDSAIQIILKEDYPSRKQYYKKRLLDSLGYIPERFVKLLHEEPLPSYTLDRLRSDAKFMWDTKISLEKAAFLKYIEADLAYTEALTEVTPLRYTFVVHTLRETWIVYVDAITGQLYKMRDDHYFTCEPNIPLAAYELDHLWYYNFTNQKIDLSTCQYGNNATCQVLRLSNNKLNAFCKNGTFDNNSPGYVPTKNFIDWSVSPDFIPATINLNIVQLPTAINNPDGNVVVSLNPANPLGSNAYTYTATQILSDNGFVATTIGNTTNNGAITTISSGIYELTITDDQNCAYTDYIAIGSQGGFTVTATTTNPNCYRNAGDIHLSIGSANSFGGQNPQIAIKGPFSTNGFVTVPVLSINNDVFNLSISQFNDINTSNDNLPLPPGNYAILVKNPSNNKIGYVNVRLNYPDCETERKILQTAFWAIDRTHKYFRGETLIPITNTIGSNSFNIALPTTIIPTGYTQFANSATAIAIGLVDGPQTNAKFETTSINSSEFRFVISKGTNTNSPCVPLDVMAHEYAHGINALGNQVSGNPDVFSEAEAINEGFSDIMGCIVEATSEATVDWIAGDAMDDGAYATKRNLADPNSQGLPSIYGSELYNNPDLNLEFTFGLNYIRSMIFSHWFYLLTEGGSQTIGNTNYTVSGIGMEKAAKITLAAFVSSAFGLDELSNKNYAGLCKATLLAANALYPPTTGVCSPEVQAVRQAWQAVGVLCPPPPGLTCSLCLPTDPDNNTCDNHLPYISSVLVQDISTSQEIYNAVWQDDDENNPIQQCLSYSTAPQTTDFSAGLMILVSTSEDMSNLQLLGLRASDGTMYDASNGLSVVAETVSPDQYFFTISLDPEVYINEDDYRLVFAGEDLAGNLLEERQIYPSYSADCIDIGDIPQRASDGEWQPPAMGGNDEVHTIHIDLCLNALVAATDRTSNFCFSAAADIDPLCGTTICTNTAVLLTNQSYYLEGEFQYHWNFGDDASPAFIDENTFESHEVSWASPGTKTVELLATYLTNNVTQTFTMEIEVVDDPFCSVDLATALSQTITAPSPGETDGAIHLILPDNYPTEQLTDIVWYPLDENGNTMTDNQGNIITIADNNNTPTDLVDIAAGKYRFSATVAMRCEHIEKDIELLDNCFEVSITPVCNGDGTIQLTVDILGGQSPYSYLMNGGMSASQSNNTLAWATLNSFMEETNLPAHFMTTIFMPNFFTVTITDANNCQSVRTGSATCTPCTTDLVVTQVICPNPLSNEIIVVFNKIVTDISAGIPSGFSGPDISLSLSNNQQFALFSVLDATTGCTLTGIASCTNGVFTETGTIVGIDNCAGYPSFNDPPLFTQIYIPQSVCAEQQICVPYSVIDVDGLGTLMPNKPNTTLYPDVEESTVRTGTLCWTPTSADIGTQHLRLYVMDLHCNSLITTLLSSNLGITFLEKRPN